VTTNVLSGAKVLLSTGDAVRADLASAAIPGVLPAVEREGLTLVDGGVADNAALSQAVALGAREIYVLPAGFTCARQRPPISARAAAVQAITLLIEQRLVRDRCARPWSVSDDRSRISRPQTSSTLDSGSWASSAIRASPCSAWSPRRAAAACTAGSLRRDGSMRAGFKAQPLAQAAMSGSAP
jgi:predicted acylesterase/phospholipase RssA